VQTNNQLDISGELKALEDRTRALKTRQKIAIGAVIIAIGIVKLFTTNELAGLLLDAIGRAKATPSLKEDWGRSGEAFFRRKSKSGNGAAGNNGGGRRTLPGKPANPAPAATKPKGDAPDLLSRAQPD
jgi:hypothetical protein